MALSKDYSTSHGITASYWRIEELTIEPPPNYARAVLAGHLNWEQAGGPNQDPNRTRPATPSEPLAKFQFVFKEQDYLDHIKNITADNQLAEAYNAIKQIGTPYRAKEGIDFSDATDID
jgi:hypothetical protein